MATQDIISLMGKDVTFLESRSHQHYEEVYEVITGRVVGVYLSEDPMSHSIVVNEDFRLLSEIKLIEVLPSLVVPSTLGTMEAPT